MHARRRRRGGGGGGEHGNASMSMVERLEAQRNGSDECSRCEMFDGREGISISRRKKSRFDAESGRLKSLFSIEIKSRLFLLIGKCKRYHI